MNQRIRILLTGTLLIALLSLASCFELQRAVGCNNTGIFGCKDKAESPPQGPETYPELKRAPEPV